MFRSFCLGVLVAVLALATLGRDATTAGSRPAEEAPAPASTDARGLEQGLSSLPFLSHARTRSVCAENPTGARGQGGRAVPDKAQADPPASARAADELGQGWKVRPFLRVNKGQTATLMDVDGPGVIQHIWMAGPMKWSRAHVLRFYWDGEETPSIEVPAADFFAVGHGKFAPVHSLAVVTNPQDALNCYWPMPFRKHARVTFSNDSTTDDVTLLAYQITYAEAPIPADAGYFHAQFRRARTDRVNPYVILDGVRGHGRYVGTFLAWTQREKGWFGEGEVKFFLDGDEEFPTICGTGTEDYFCGSYGFATPFTGPYTGTTLPASDQGPPPNFWSLYRWHIMDPINFERDLRVTIQALGWYEGKPLYKKLSDDVASVAFWYQAEPHSPFPSLPSLADRGATVLPAPAN
ncbi:glycoside hydrolase family 172 protein [Aquisphaera insulae]|uniref:glycoside hydrolase family 172 protein n=1 Tax=Aquisphaera insulae TaxID=2712864 RepID=UPI0013ED72CB|nr:glycoside hydrolase family 172 protein [Aquisphaera insulae]